MSDLPNRRNGIGASEAAAALGLSKYKTALELYFEKIGEAPPFSGNLATEAGLALEPIVLGEYEKRSGHKLTALQERAPFAGRPWLWATIDAKDEHLPAVIEAKTARGGPEWGDPGTDQVPQGYVAQSQVQMACVGYALAIIPVIFRGPMEYVEYRVNADAELFRMMLAGLDDFWARVQRRDPPDPSTYNDIKLRWPKDTGTQIMATPEVLTACAELSRIKREISDLETISEQHEALIKTALADAATLTADDGTTLATWKSSKASRAFDAKRYQTEHPDLIEPYMVEKSGSRRFLLKGAK
jgi:putative phage-type endonuclease